MKKLTTITTQYSKFSDNQVLTKGQLNTFLDYFEDQDHLSRIALSGVGIVCGFKVTFNATSKKITISKGYGVTTDGDLLTLVEQKPTIEGETQETGLQLIADAFKTYTHYRSFEDNKVSYAPFVNADDTSMELLEIFPESEIDLTSGLYTNLSDLVGIQDRVVLLYLENYAKEGDLCTALDCDNQGIEQIARLRILLVSSDDAESIANQDSILTKQNIEDYLKLPEIAVLRDIINAENTKDYQSLKQRYFNVISNETITDLGKNLDIILNKLNLNTISGSISSLFGMSPSAIPKDFQYRYDVLKDLVDTYAEIKNLLFHLNVLCCPSIGAFPKHLLLGRLDEVGQQYKSLRHNFYKSPIVGHEDDNLKKVKSLLSRVQDLVTNYQKETKGSEIKITPSQAHGVLSNKAIPFYYKINEDLLNHWSYNKYKNFVQTSNLSYHTANLSAVPSVKTPLLYNIDSFNFLRIEGVQGKSYREALDQVIGLKEKYGLSFDVKTLSVNATTSDININDYKCQFEDLSILLKAWRTEQNCVLAAMSEYFSGFSTKEVGKNVVGIRNGYDQRLKEIGKNIDIEVGIDDPKITERTLLESSSNLDLTKITGASIFNMEIAKVTGSDKSNNLWSYNKKNIVKETLTTEDDTLGKILAASIDENNEDSANDILARFNEGTKEVIASEAWKEDAPLAEFIFKDVAEVLVHSYFLDKRIPTTIPEIVDSTLSQYKLTINELCNRIKGLQTKYQSTKIDEGSKQILGLLINQMSTVCCSGKKLEILLEEIEIRKAEILKQIQLSEFVKKHPGLRHQAGVPMGGTFVMAYLTENATDQLTYETVRMELGFVSQPNLDNEKENGGYIKLWDERASTDFVFIDERKNLFDLKRLTKINKYTSVGVGETLKETVANLAAFFNYTWKVAGFSKNCKATSNGNILIIELIDQQIKEKENYIEFSDLGLFKKTRGFNNFLSKTNRLFFNENEIIVGNITDKNTVIADFALPYMCCSDCAPINFIVPREPISLSLPTDSICLGEEDAELLTFTISPNDGEVKSVVDAGVNGGVIQNDEGLYQFDANVLDSSLYGTPIKFTLNDQDTNASIIVNKKVKAEVSTSVTYNNEKKSATVTYVVKGEDIQDTTTFSWNFDNGKTSDEAPDGNGEVTVEYDLTVIDENTIKPTLSISNGTCKSNIEIAPITFEDSVAELKIDGTQFCVDKGETIEIPFDIKPDTAKLGVNGAIKGITIKGRTIVVESSDFSAFKTPIGFLVDGEVLPNSPTITIISKTDFASFTYEPENPSVKAGTKTVDINFTITGLTDLQKKEYGFIWDFGDRQSSDDSDTKHTYNISEQEAGEVVFAVVLVIEGGPCGSVRIPKDVKITINKTEVDTDNPQNCAELISNAISKDRAALSDNVDISEKLLISVVRPTITLYAEVTKNMSEYLNGNKNNNLNDLFSELIQSTGVSILENKDNTFVTGILSNFLRAQIRLFYNILHCQSKDVVEKSIDIINRVVGVIANVLKRLQGVGIQFDTGKPDPKGLEGTLRQYLNNYLIDPETPETLKNAIDTLINLILPIR